MKLKHKSNEPCQQCNLYFLVDRTSKKTNMFCSDNCRTEYKKTHFKTRTCQYCKKEYRKKFSNKKFCSVECNILHRTKFKLKELNCLWCNKLFNTRKRQFCSRSCYNEYIKIHPNKKRTGYYTTCELCITVFYVDGYYPEKKYCSKSCADFSRRGKGNKKWSEKISELISLDKFQIRSKFKTGYYTSKTSNITFFYQSSYELKRMQQLDKLGVKWTKRHGIRIKYIDYDGKERYYVPDFLINDKIIEEVKPGSLLNSRFFRTPLKTAAGIEYCKLNNLEYRIITEKELEIIL